MHTYGYLPERITIERPVYFGSSIHDKRADIFCLRGRLARYSLHYRRGEAAQTFRRLGAAQKLL
ncbi:MAG: hypothetical protein ACYDBJ_09045 [Aggregatilineales bacterium]